MTWLHCRRPRPAARVRLVCFPYAGGNAVTYRRWEELLPESIELHTAQLPGRVPRFSEAPLSSIDALGDALALAAAPVTAAGPYALFGHSMGAVLAFEVARRLVRTTGRQPALLAVSARAAPHLPWRREPIHTLPDAPFLAAIGRLAGTPAAVLADPELMALVLPALRADFAAIERYRMPPGPPLACTIAVFGGHEDRGITADDLLAWQLQTTGRALVQMLPGGHFFIDTDAAALVKTLVQDLAHL